MLCSSHTTLCFTRSTNVCILVITSKIILTIILHSLHTTHTYQHTHIHIGTHLNTQMQGSGGVREAKEINLHFTEYRHSRLLNDGVKPFTGYTLLSAVSHLMSYRMK